MPDFWKLSGYPLLAQREDGMLGVTDDFLRAFFLRPELQLEAESCAAERAIRQALIDDPRRPVNPLEIESIEDPDARENYSVVLQFRDKLLAANSIESCYVSLFQSGVRNTPPLFIDQLSHVILRNILKACDDPVRLRAAELLFRTQKVSLQDGAVLMADEETTEMKRETAGLGNFGRLLLEMDATVNQVELEVLSTRNSACYWDRSDRYDLVFDASFGQPGQEALCRVLEGWIAHLLGVETRITPLAEIRDDRWVWHVGLDAESSAILNDLYEGKDLDDEQRRRLLALFRLDFMDDATVRQEVKDRPVYLGLAVNKAHVVALKPQNLLVNLPVVPAS